MMFADYITMRRVMWALGICYIMALIISGGCGGKESPIKPVTVTPPSVVGITVSPSTATLEVGGSQRFTATARTGDGSVVNGVVFEWTSSNTSVLTINTDGVATAVAAGSTTIKAVANGVSSLLVTITVTQSPVVRVSVNPSSAQQMTVDDTRTFTATARTADNLIRDDVNVLWSSSNTGVVAINSDGEATAVAAGVAMIRAEVDGVRSSPVAVTVTGPPPPMVAVVTVRPSSASVEVGGMQLFQAAATTDDGTAVPDVEFTWTSSDEVVATISSTGLATGIHAGEVTITATAGDRSGTATVQVTDPPPPEPVVAVVTVRPSSASVEVGGMQLFQAAATTDDGTAVPDVEFTWTSSDEVVATISSTGLATGIHAGEVTITATAGDRSGTATLQVTDPPPPEPVVAVVTVRPSSASVEVGGMQLFQAAATTDDGTAVPDVEFTWTSSDEVVATISSTGLATGIHAGEVTITATAGDRSSTATLQVTDPPPPEPVVAVVTVRPSSASVEVGGMQLFQAAATTDDGTAVPDVEFTWTSSDEVVATISSTGLATGIHAGEVTITATAGDRSGTATLQVTDPPPPEPVVAVVTVSPSSASVEVGGKQLFQAAATTDDGTAVPDVEFTWTSSDEVVATISSTGLATGIHAGEVTIIATAGDRSGTATVQVTDPPPPEPVVAVVTVRPSSASVEVGGMQLFQAAATTDDGTAVPDVEFTWTSSDEVVATISSTGLATGIHAGEVTITATAGDRSGTATLQVTDPPPPEPVVAVVTVRPSSASVEVGGMQLFQAAATTDDGTAVPDVEFTWTSSDEVVATISSTGLATGIHAGEVTRGMSPQVRRPCRLLIHLHQSRW